MTKLAPKFVIWISTYWARGKENYRENDLTCAQSNSTLVTWVWAEPETPEPHCYTSLHTLNQQHSVPIPTKVASLELTLGRQNSCREDTSFDIFAKRFLKSEVFHFWYVEENMDFLSGVWMDRSSILAQASPIQYFVNSETEPTNLEARCHDWSELNLTTALNPCRQEKLSIHIGRAIFLVPVKSAAKIYARGCLIQVLSPKREAKPKQWGHQVMCTPYSPLNLIQLLHLLPLQRHVFVLGQEHRLRKFSEMPLHLAGSMALQCSLS